MKKFLLFTLTLFPMLSLSAYASPISLSLFQDGFSVLDKLFLIGLGIALIGLIFLCIAYCKSVSRKEKPIDSPFDIYLEDDSQEEELSDEIVSSDNDDITPEDEFEAPDEADEITPDPSPEIPAEDFEESIPEEPSVAEVLEDVPEKFPEEPVEEPVEELPEETPEEITDEIPEDPTKEAAEETPEEVTDPTLEKEPESIIYPKLILTNVVTNDFVILPLYPETTVGRKTDNDLVLSDVTISGLHCKILNEDGKIFVVDENSTNGTFVNDERISEKAQIHHGDKLTLGKQEFNISVNE